MNRAQAGGADNGEARQILRRAPSPLKADIYLDTQGGTPTVVKDFSRAPRWLRHILGRLLLGREARCLQTLAGIEGVPAFLERIGPHAYRMEFVPGDLPSLAALGADGGRLLAQLAQRVAALHQRGVTHNDLRLKNMLLTPQNQLYLLDFGAAMHRPASRAFWTLPGHWLFAYLRRTDCAKLARLKHRCGGDLSATERELIQRTRWARCATQLWKRRILPLLSHRKRR
ncbi:MAG: phosphotransferase [Cellvibrionales bacterium]|nr:phosphotransferase [Cellvibrionales bacterium]